MRFGKTLRAAIYAPWKDEYVDYGKLKSLLREDHFDEDGGPAWTEEDENRFCDEIFNVQLEKVARFQQERVDALRQRADAVFDRLRELAPDETAAGEEEVGPVADASKKEAARGGKDVDDDAADKSSAKNASANDGDAARDDVAPRLRALEAELDEITNELRELKKYSSINYTAFRKIVKKHDRYRGDRYRVRPMMQLSLAQRPFNSEHGYAPLLNKLSIMYFAIRQLLEGGRQAVLDLESPDETHNGERYAAHKFWVHTDNLLEVKTLILRHLPALVYSEQAAKELDGSDSPTITSLYLDNRQFDLYSDKVNRQSEASSLRLRWYGQLSSRPQMFIEQKMADAKGYSSELRFTIKDKYVKPFLDGDYAMDKSVQKMERQGASAEQVASYRAAVAKMQHFVQEKKLSPVLRANYARTAFQKPTDDRVRISIDTDLAFVREDTLDRDRPCRDPKDWHRLDIDNGNLSYPFRNINQSEISRFPHALLEIRLKEEAGTRKRPAWVEDLMASHLVHPAPRFSKYVHGVASLFEDYVNTLPFWLSDLEADIRKDPQQAFEEEEQRRAQRADEAMVVGSLIGGVRAGSSYKATQSSPIGRSYLESRKLQSPMAPPTPIQKSIMHRAGGEEEGRDDDDGDNDEGRGEQEGESSTAVRQRQPDEGLLLRDRGGYGTLASVMPGLSLSRYARAKRARKAQLPEGVVEPRQWMKNMGEPKIEPKVWLANERTFLKWQHICILQGSLALGLYTAAGNNRAAEAMGILYVAIAAFAGLWGYRMLRLRRSMILERSGKDFDNPAGPIIVSVSLMAALVLNFVLQYRKAFDGEKLG